MIGARYVLFVVSFCDSGFDAVVNVAADSKEVVLQVLVARTLADERDRRVTDFCRHGVHVLEAGAGSMGLEIINRYFEIKMRQLI